MTKFIHQNLRQLRDKNPLIHNITNYVVMNNTANALLAIGASPAMIHAVEECEGFTAISSALVINIGTLSSHWVEGMHKSAAIAQENNIPFILDPVGVGATKFRTDTVNDLLTYRPAIIRGNASEILTVAGSNIVTGKGVDTTAELDDVRAIAKVFSQKTGIVCAITGAQDYITDGEREVTLENGDPLMSKVTGMGCTATAIIGGFLGAGIAPFDAAVSGLAVLAIAGEIAAEKAKGPGSLQSMILDRLYTIDKSDIDKRLRAHDSVKIL